MDIDHLNALNEKLRPYRRTTWLPEVVEDDAAVSARCKFSGVPALRPGEAWPACGNCRRPMQLFLQLDARDVPGDAAAALRGGVLQLFYCTSVRPECEVECEAFFPRARSTLVRLLAAGEAAPEPEGLVEGWRGVALPEGMFPAKRIVAWTAADDYPDAGELEMLGLDLSDEEQDALYGRDFPLDGEKLLGWPKWVQDVEYPDCRECGRRMEHVFQIDSEQSLPYMFGDVGIGHVTQCPEHPGELAFGWACT